MCMKVKEVQRIRTEWTGWVIREEINGLLCPYFNYSYNCVGKLGDTITDPLWNSEQENSRELIGKEIREGCLHVFKNLDDARAAIARYNDGDNVIIVKVAIQPGRLLVGETFKFDKTLDPLDCYGCKSYKLVSEGE